jgi:hypothetical protein
LVFNSREGATMDEATWGVCAEPSEMLNFLQTSGRGSERKLRLVACAFCRAVEGLLTDACYRGALDAAERYADGLADAGELLEAHWAAARAERHTDVYEWSEDKKGMLSAANAVGWATLVREPPDPPAYLAGCAAAGAQNASLYAGLPEADVKAGQCTLIRDVLGPLLFRAVTVHPPILRWHNGTVVRLAQAIYAARRFGDLPTLADALEEAGCNDPEVLVHCRTAGPHVRGCWVIDLLIDRQ